MGLGAKRVVCIAAALAAGTMALNGCGAAAAPGTAPVTSVVPSSAGAPNSVATWGTFEFVSVQGTGEIFSYNLASGVQVPVSKPYLTPCSSPSGMAVAQVGGANVLAVTCFDTGSVLTLTVHADGSLSALGAVGGLDAPYPGLALEGTNVLVPLFGKNHAENGAVAKVSLANPAAPVVTGMATLLPGVANGYSNPAALAVSGGYVYVAAGSEDGPLSTSSTIQVVNEASMQVVGTPLAVDHSPQRVAIQGSTAFVTEYDAAALLALDLSAPAQPRLEKTLDLPGCSALPVVLSGSRAVVGCYGQGSLMSVDVSQPSSMHVVATETGIPAPQSFAVTDGKLVVASGATGGAVFVMNTATGLSGTL